MPKLIQRTELKTFYYTPVHCPFCGMSDPAPKNAPQRKWLIGLLVRTLSASAPCSSSWSKT